MIEWLLRKGSPTALAVFRVAIGGLSLLNALFLFPDALDWFGPRGLVPLSAGAAYLQNGEFRTPRMQAFGPLQGEWVAYALLIGIVVAAGFTMLGRFTRIATFALAILTVTMHHRDALLLMGADSALRIACLYLACADAGATLSWDRLVEKRRGDLRRDVALWPQRLVAYNVALVYATTLLSKWQGTTWRDGTATYYPLRLAEFERFPVPEFLKTVEWSRVTTYGTLLTEFAMAFLVWFRVCRPYALVAGVGMHLFIEYAMNIPLFSFVMIAMYACFIEGDEWDRGLAWARARLPFGRRALGRLSEYE